MANSIPTALKEKSQLTLINRFLKKLILIINERKFIWLTSDIMTSENLFILFIQERLAKEKKLVKIKILSLEPETSQFKITANPTLFGTSPCLWLLFTGGFICKAALLCLLPFNTGINQDSILKFISQHIKLSIGNCTEIWIFFFLVKFFPSYLPNEFKLFRYYANLNKSCHI